jgi:site-specific recombinase XerD
VSGIVRRALGRAGVSSATRGAHLLRHSAATAMLRDGISLPAIGVVLRHRSVETTALYAKVDVPVLRAVAQPWIGGVPC